MINVSTVKHFLSRRAFLRRASMLGIGALALPSILAACDTGHPVDNGTVTPTNLDNYSFTCGFASDITKNGTWFRDKANRYVLFRGVNFGSRSKLPPYVPVLPLAATSLPPNGLAEIMHSLDSELTLLDDLGVNIVRLPIMWKAIEPQPNNDLGTLEIEGQDYLRAISDIISHLWLFHGIFVLIDFHQDVAHEIYNGSGFPNWAVGIDGRHTVPGPKDFLGNQLPPWAFSPVTQPKESKWGLSYYDQGPFTAQVAYDVRNTLHSFWNNSLKNTQFGLTDYPVRTHLEKTIGQVANYFNQKGQTVGILGYEPFNEPHPVGFDKQQFESQILLQYYTNVLQEIRQYDDKAFLFIEPRMDWTTFPANGPEYNVTLDGIPHFTNSPRTFLQTPSTDRVVFSFHYYDPWITTIQTDMIPGFSWPDRLSKWPAIFSTMRNAADNLNLIPFLSEFGVEQNWGTDLVVLGIDTYYEQVDAQLLNATYWNYDLFNTRDNYDNWNHENLSILGPDRERRHIESHARIYPMRSSGRPQRIFFDPLAKGAGILLEGQDSGAPTVIFVPRKIHYGSPLGDHFEVRVTDGQIKWDEDRQLLYWLTNSTQQHQIVINAVGHFDLSYFPDEFKSVDWRSIPPVVVGKD